MQMNCETRCLRCLKNLGMVGGLWPKPAKPFVARSLRRTDVALVGGKNASLGEMASRRMAGGDGSVDSARVR
jgi:hypothetical protein